jgi:hypothetical protein
MAPFPAVLARGMKATRPPESNPHHPPLLQTLGRCPFKAAQPHLPVQRRRPWGSLLRRNPEWEGKGEGVEERERGEPEAALGGKPKPLPRRHAPARAAVGKKKKGAGGEEEEKEERGRGCTAAPPTGAAEARRRAAGPPARCPACREAA